MTEKEIKNLLFGVWAFAEGEQRERVEKAQSAVEGLFKELREYRSIGTVEEFRDSMEKKKPKKPVDTTPCKDEGENLLLSVGKCPSCNCIVSEDMLWCDECGQKLDWTDNR